MSTFALAFAVCSLVVAVAVWGEARKQRIRATRASAEAAALLADRATSKRIARQAEREQALADAALIRELALRCYPTGDPEDVVFLGPVHEIEAPDPDHRDWFIHVRVPIDLSEKLSQAGIWQPDARPASALLNFLLPAVLSESGAVVLPASAGEGDR